MVGSHRHPPGVLSKHTAAAHSTTQRTRRKNESYCWLITNKGSTQDVCFHADPRLTDYDTLLQNIQDLKSGQPTQVSMPARHSACAVPAPHLQLICFSTTCAMLTCTGSSCSIRVLTSSTYTAHTNMKHTQAAACSGCWWPDLPRIWFKD